MNQKNAMYEVYRLLIETRKKRIAAANGVVSEATPLATAKETQAFQPESNDILLPGQLKNQSINY